MKCTKRINWTNDNSPNAQNSHSLSSHNPIEWEKSAANDTTYEIVLHKQNVHSNTYVAAVEVCECVFINWLRFFGILCVFFCVSSEKPSHLSANNQEIIPIFVCNIKAVVVVCRVLINQTHNRWNVHRKLAHRICFINICCALVFWSLTVRRNRQRMCPSDRSLEYFYLK